VAATFTAPSAGTYYIGILDCQFRARAAMFRALRR
jgi:hypothetical protein